MCNKRFAGRQLLYGEQLIVDALVFVLVLGRKSKIEDVELEMASDEDNHEDVVDAIPAPDDDSKSDVRNSVNGNTSVEAHAAGVGAAERSSEIALNTE